MPGIDESLLEAMRLPGARSAAVVDWVSGLALGVAGEAPGGDHEAAACETAELARMVAEYRSFGPLTTARGPDGSTAVPPVEDIITTNADSYHLLRFVTGALDGSFFLHLWLARDEGNLALARMRLARIADRMVL
ncbi:hypothetical protein ACH4LN_04475 [Streptomyces albus]|uniref:Uncharacterized protein n=1 Tax=Streptomyces albus TaxID=1888 RepID=A0A6C1CAF5_9ACTN|nr:MULTISPECIES: hypothetical protein [Streptomyces]KPC95173.1 hypothetical protein ADL27_10420 [Streptomyces sp. NRRL F-6602]EPD92912.1 hypothetical protein HMPREF1486_03989 [Streptomyces sp. HPH0547]QID39041.1 hypothetical protein G3260_005815 [Streptomyces albus]TGG85547.1 hypothetical protein D8771_10285 [Streptomyces albus]UVN53932.1 hypothetical protein NR995_04875 [Streptomyces albus]